MKNDVYNKYKETATKIREICSQIKADEIQGTRELYSINGLNIVIDKENVLISNEDGTITLDILDRTDDATREMCRFVINEDLSGSNGFKAEYSNSEAYVVGNFQSKEDISWDILETIKKELDEAQIDLQELEQENEQANSDDEYVLFEKSDKEAYISKLKNGLVFIDDVDQLGQREIIVEEVLEKQKRLNEQEMKIEGLKNEREK